MSTSIRNFGIFVMVLSFIGLIIGAVFVYQGFAKQDLIVSDMRSENITMASFGGTSTNLIDTADEAQKAADTIRSHRHNIAPNYTALLGGKQFDPTNPTQLSYVQAINLENYLYLGVTALGLDQIALASGGFMIFISLGLGITGYVLMSLAKKV